QGRERSDHEHREGRRLAAPDPNRARRAERPGTLWVPGGSMSGPLRLMDFSTLYPSFWSFTVTGLANGSIYALVALGYTLVYGVLRLINFAHSEVFMIGTLAALVSLRWVGADAYRR